LEKENDGQNGTQSSKSNVKDNEFMYNVLIIYRHLNIVKLRV
jgi:hypothetical protein